MREIQSVRLNITVFIENHHFFKKLYAITARNGENDRIELY